MFILGPSEFTVAITGLKTSSMSVFCFWVFVLQNVPLPGGAGVGVHIACVIPSDISKRGGDNDSVYRKVQWAAHPLGRKRSTDGRKRAGQMFL